MTTPFRHPTDDALFDFAEGTLDAARVPELERHLARCAACAAFVASARVGAAKIADAVEVMPEDARASLDAALDAAWTERSSAATMRQPAVAAAPGGIDAARVDDTIQLDRVAPAARVRREARVGTRPRRRFVRSAIPVFAVIVVGVLAGTSVYVDGLDDRDERTSGSSAAQSTQDDVAGGAADGAAGGEADSSAESTAAAPERSAEPPAPDGFGDDGRAAPGAGAPAASADGSGAGADWRGADGSDAPRAGADGRTADGTAFDDAEAGGLEAEICIATSDPTRLFLPEGRIPREVIDGPLGTFVVCG